MIRKLLQYLADRKAQKEYDAAVAHLSSPDLFTDAMRKELKALFPKEWTHMDNFSQEEIFKIAFTMTMLGYNCDAPAKLKTAMDVLLVQNIIAQDSYNPAVIKRYH